MRQLACFLLVAATLGACASRETVLTVPAVSMTNPSLKAGKSVAPAGRVQAEYCEGDDSLLSDGDNNIGLIDEAVVKAERDSGAVYLSDVTVTRKGDCVSVDAIAMK